MNTEPVRVLVYTTFERDGRLEFGLIFSDNCEKYYNFDEYGIRQFRGMQERQIMEQCAREYFEDLRQPVDFIQLIFL